MSDPVQITLGDRTYGVRAQRIGRLADKLGDRFGQIVDMELGGDGASQLASLGGAAHEILRVFIPEVMPLPEFLGYASEADMREGRRPSDPDADRSPTLPEIEQAFRTAFDVNGFGVLGHLKALVEPEVLRKMITLQISRTLTSGSGGSPSSPQPSGESDQPSSGTSAPSTPEPLVPTA